MMGSRIKLLLCAMLSLLCVCQNLWSAIEAEATIVRVYDSNGDRLHFLYKNKGLEDEKYKFSFDDYDKVFREDNSPSVYQDAFLYVGFKTVWNMMNELPGATWGDIKKFMNNEYSSGAKFHLIVFINHGQSSRENYRHVMSYKQNRCDSSETVTLTGIGDDEWILAVHLDYHTHHTPEFRCIAPGVDTAMSVEPLLAAAVTKEWRNSLTEWHGNIDSFSELFDDCFWVIRHATDNRMQADYSSAVSALLSQKEEKLNRDYQLALNMQQTEQQAAELSFPPDDMIATLFQNDQGAVGPDTSPENAEKYTRLDSIFELAQADSNYWNYIQFFGEEADIIAARVLGYAVHFVSGTKEPYHFITGEEANEKNALYWFRIVLNGMKTISGEFELPGYFGESARSTLAANQSKVSDSLAKSECKSVKDTGKSSGKGKATKTKKGLKRKGIDHVDDASAGPSKIKVVADFEKELAGFYEAVNELGAGLTNYLSAVENPDILEDNVTLWVDHYNTIKNPAARLVASVQRWWESAGFWDWVKQKSGLDIDNPINKENHGAIVTKAELYKGFGHRKEQMLKRTFDQGVDFSRTAKDHIEILSGLDDWLKEPLKYSLSEQKAILILSKARYIYGILSLKSQQGN